VNRVIAVIGFILAAVILLVVFLGVLFFMVPNMQIGGATSVVQRNNYTRYSGRHVREMFYYRNIMIESHDVDIEIRVRKKDQYDAGSILVFENATGISFNSNDRTLVEYRQINDPEHGIFYKIIISEPSGILTRNARVYLNLFCTDVVDGPYNFILNTRRSRVTFDSDEDTRPDSVLRIDSLIVNNATGVINMPTKTGNQFFVDVGKLQINSVGARFNGATDIEEVEITSSSTRLTVGNVSGDIRIRDSAVNLTAGDVGGMVHVRNSNVTIKTGAIAGGASHMSVDLRANTIANFTATGTVAGDFHYNSPAGSVSLQHTGNTYVDTVDAHVRIHGTANSLYYTATGFGSCSVNRVMGPASVRTVTGNATVGNANNEVFVETRSGVATVIFDPALPKDVDGPPLTVRAFDGNVNTSNIVGRTDIRVENGGRAQVRADFRRIVGSSTIYCEYSTNPRSTHMNVFVTIQDGIAPSTFTLYRTAHAQNRTTTPNLFPGIQFFTNSSDFVLHTYQLGGDGESTGNLTITTANRFELWRRA
jgi:hypothetical protein